jgi:hypothetical protein
VFAPFALLVGCAPEPEPSSEPPRLSPVERAVRLSMALRGVRPSFEELDQVQADPDALTGLVDGWLDSDEFGATVRDLANEALQLRSDGQTLDATGSLRGYDLSAINAELQEAPLRTVERVVVEDRPYSEILTGDWTMADDLVASAWVGLERYDGDGGWVPLRWTDGRPAAGILSDSSIWVRWRSAGANAQRGRANLVARSLLCEDFLSRDAAIDSSAVADPTGGTSLQSPSCSGCHALLDPLASFFPWELYPDAHAFQWPIRVYDDTWTDREGWLDTTGVEPDYFGLGGRSFQDLADLIVSDPRFTRCAATRFWSFLHQSELADAPPEAVDALQAELLETDSAKSVLRDIVLAPDFSELDPVDPEPYRVRAEALPRLFADLTGFAWVIDGTETCCNTADGRVGDVDLGEDAYRGWVVLWGGIDGPYIARPTHQSSTTSSMILDAYAKYGAQRVVADDFAQADPDARRLLRWVEADTTDEDAVRTQLAKLELRLWGEQVDPADTDDGWELFRAVLADSADPRRAWTVVLSAMLADDRVEYY